MPGTWIAISPEEHSCHDVGCPPSQQPGVQMRRVLIHVPKSPASVIPPQPFCQALTHPKYLMIINELILQGSLGNPHDIGHEGIRHQVLQHRFWGK